MKTKLLTPIFFLFFFLFCAASNKAYIKSPAFKAYRKSSSNKILKGSSKTEQRYLTYTASLNLQVAQSKWKNTMNAIINFTKKQNGYVSSQSLDSVKVKIPSSKFKTAFEYFKKLGEVLNENVNIEDIGEVYIDTKVRLENSLKLQKRLKELLNKSANVTEAVKVEKELSRVTEKIESLKAKIRYYQNSLDYSTIDIEFSKPQKPGPLGWVFYGLYKGIKWLFIWD